MTEHITSPGDFPSPGRQVSVQNAAAQATDGGIEVHEQEWGTVITVQRMYKVRCACGRSWFELELPKFVTCPACHKLGLVPR